MSTKKTRRETLTFIGAAGLATLTACGSDDNAGIGTGTTGGGGNGTTGGTSTTTGGNATTAATSATTGGNTATTSATTSGASTTSGTTTTAGTGGAGGNGTTGSGGAGGAGTGGSGTGGGGGGDAGTVQCKAKEESTVGPFPNINPLERKDVRANTSGNTTPKQGMPLTLRIGVYDLGNGCAPIPDAVVDIWHCDAVGVYSGYANFQTAGQDFGRGFQRTDARGIVEFSTIFPGSYAGRAIHIHFSIQATEKNLRPNDDGPAVPGVFVSQLYFLRAVADAIFTATPLYQQGAPITPNESDGFFTGDGGRDLIIDMTKSGAGYVGEIQVGVRRSDIGK
jgi:protocatechuate 3,4-dioxygenase beta subunit